MEALEGARLMYVFFSRLSRFLKKPRREKFKRIWDYCLPFIPLPVRLPFGGWWLAWNDATGDAVFLHRFEEAEQLFVEHLLKPGMTVLDIGAHHGLYTLLASFKVGPQGRVIAFEPSPRERRKLLWHIRLNRCCNVRVEAFALGSREEEARLFVVNGRETGCNSLRQPNVSEPTWTISVPVVRLDEYLRQESIKWVDFIKVDVEGAELEVFRGATELLRFQRPVILCEVADIRTQPWGYRAKEIILLLQEYGYDWFQVLPNGSLLPITLNDQTLDGNWVAVPKERLVDIQALVKEIPPCMSSG